jgi:hypothetical protein
MLTFHRWQSKTALILALGMTATALVPILISTAAIARSQPNKSELLLSQSSRDDVVPAGTTIPVTFDKDKIIVKPDETAKAKLIVAQNIISDSGRVVIPEGSEINGELRPVDGGTQYVAKNVITRRNRDQRFPIEATSQIITRTETINQKTSRDVLKGAAIGAAAGAVLSEIFGDIDLGEVLAGAGVGALASVLQGKKEKEVEVVVVEPERDLELTLEEDLETDLVPVRR